jgi:hypothetical protein
LEVSVSYSTGVLYFGGFISQVGHCILEVSVSYLKLDIVFWRYLFHISSWTFYFEGICFISQVGQCILEVSVSYLKLYIVFWRCLFHISAETFILEKPVS